MRMNTHNNTFHHLIMYKKRMFIKFEHESVSLHRSISEPKRPLGNEVHNYSSTFLGLCRFSRKNTRFVFYTHRKRNVIGAK